MELLRSTTDLARVPGPVVIAIGVFDGLHLGHKAVIQTAIRAAAEGGGTPLVLTFEPHPARILKPEMAPPMLMGTDQKLKLLRAWGLRHVLLLPFTRETAQTPPEEFIRQLASHSAPLSAVCVGETWSFGKERRGNLALLESLGSQFGFKSIGVPELLMDGAVVSSTRIRNAIAAGDFATSTKLLGREYIVAGMVGPGRRLGRTLGFPTANIALSSAVLPPFGVYTVEVSRAQSTAPHRGVANIGRRPTVGLHAEEPVLEVHLLDESGDFYGQTWEVRFCEFLRPEMRFAHVDALRNQIAQDVAEARARFAL